MSNTVTTHQTPSIASIASWIRFGWQEFKQTPTLSALCALPFILFAIVLQPGMFAGGYGLVYYLLCGGFMLTTPVLAVIFYAIYAENKQGTRPGFGIFFTAWRGLPGAIWALLLISGILFIIWITDALIIYAVYFPLKPIYLTSLAEGDPVIQAIFPFVGYTLLLGSILAAITFFISSFSIVHSYLTCAGLVDAIVYSIKSVAHHLVTFIAWALLVSGSQMLALILFPPLELLLLPLFAYANIAAYQETQ